MPFFSQACLDQIRRQVSIVDVVSPYVQLKPSGHYLKGLSPFSHEKTPSFFVEPQKNVFKCFSTGYAGDIFKFLQIKEQLTFTESVEWLCERFNIPIEYANSNQPAPQTFSLKKNLFRIYEQATQFFKQQFWQEDASAQKVRNYWEQERHFKLDTAREFNVGFAPSDFSLLYKFLSKQGFSFEALEQSGLFYKPKTAHTNLVSRYQNRLILPICDVQGRTIAFSGRQLPFLVAENDPTKEAKYVNSPETPIFIKGQILFNLDKARQVLEKNSSFYLVEGPLDVIRCWECGMKTVVAPQGTGLTEEQLKLLKRYDIPVVGMFDGDAAGIKAGVRLMNLGITLEIPIRYYLLNSSEDPDSAFGEDSSRCNQIKDNLLSPTDFFVKIFENLGYAGQDLQTNVLKQMFPILLACESSVLRFDLIKQLSQGLGIPQRMIEEDLQRQQKKDRFSLEKNEEEQNKKSDTQNKTLEWRILVVLFQAPRWSAAILKTLNLDWIETENLPGRLLLRILNEFQENGIETLTQRDLWHLTQEEEDLWCQLLAEPLVVENEREYLTLVLQQMNRRYLKKLISCIDKELIKSSNINGEFVKKLQMDRFSYKKALANVANSVCLEEQ